MSNTGDDREAERGISVGSLLELDEVRAGRPEILNGADALDRPVRWVHVADSEGVGALIEGGELVLSTAAGFRSSATRVRRFLEDLDQGDAAAAFVELVDAEGRADDVAGAVLAAAAEGLTLPVVILRRRIKFVRVTQAAHRLIIGKQLQQAERSRRVHEIFTQLNLESADEQHIVDTTSHLLGRPVRLEDVAKRLLLASRVDVDGQQPDSTSDYTTHQVPVGAGGRIWGALVAPGIAPQDEEAVHLLERAGQALTLARMAARDQKDLLLRARAGFLQALMGGDVSEEKEQARGRALGLRPSEIYVPVVVHLKPGRDEDATALQLRERSLTEEWLASAEQLSESVLTTSLRTGTFALVLGMRRDTGVQPALTHLVDRVESRLLRSTRRGPQDEKNSRNDSAPSGGVWTVGVAPEQRALVGAAAGLKEAAQVAAAAATMTVRDRPYYRFADIRLRGVLALLGDDVRLRTFATAELGPLLSGGPSWGLDLLETYLQRGGNKSEVARATHLSRQSLYARLTRLEEALGVSLEDPESRSALHVALLWWRLDTSHR